MVKMLIFVFCENKKKLRENNSIFMFKKNFNMLYKLLFYLYLVFNYNLL